MFRISCFILLLGIIHNHGVTAQGKGHLSPFGEGPAEGYWVYFNDKPDEGFDPFRFFDPRAIERRLRHGQCLYDPLDIPVSPAYLEAVSGLADSTSVVSRWLNAVFVYTSPEAAGQLERLPFVSRLDPVIRNFGIALLDTNGQGFDEDGPGGVDSGRLSPERAEALNRQIDHMQGRLFAENGYDGTGIRIAVFDAGFPGVDTHPAFEHLRAEGRIRATWDFHRDRPDVYRFNAHGTMVLSMITGIYHGQVMGLATGADFLLARTEIRREPFFEEKYWLAAAEWADRLGADIISSSLGYIHHRYFPEEMDGQTSLVAQAARIATRKGILVVNAAGNEGDNPRWRVIITPADVDSVMSVGAVQYPSMLRTNFSSVGPAADGSLKPNLVAMGDVVLASARGLTRRQGTSFAAPLVTGFAACLWERFPELTNMQLFDALVRSGSLYPYFDYSHGYGVPRAGVFFEAFPGGSRPTFDLETRKGELIVQFRLDPLMHGEENTPTRHLYYQVMDQEGRIEQYFVVAMDQADRLVLDKDNFSAGQRIRFHFEGYTTTWVF